MHPLIIHELFTAKPLTLLNIPHTTDSLTSDRFLEQWHDLKPCPVLDNTCKAVYLAYLISIFQLA